MNNFANSVDVILRKDNSTNDVFAIFPHDVQTPFGDVACFHPIEGHSFGNYNAMLEHSSPLDKPCEADNIIDTLKNGYHYTLHFVKSQNIQKYLLNLSKISV